MKKTLLSLIVAMVGALGSYAQSALVATLSHGSNLTTYYGESALVEAYTAAVDGDCITLSAGEFSAVETIEKAINIRGAGIKDGTILAGTTNINIEQKRTSPLILEGMKITCSEIRGAIEQTVQFIKVFIDGELNAYGCTNLFMQCCINGRITIDSTDLNINLNNCLINQLLNSKGSFVIQNCVITGGYTFSNFSNNNLLNCIIIAKEIYDSIPNASNNIEHCVGFWGGGSGNIFSNISSSTNSIVTDLSELFINFGGSFLDETNYELTDAAKAQYKGSDGTEVGIFGGASPYSTVVSSPRITNFNITSNTEDGQLKVKLNVE